RPRRNAKSSIPRMVTVRLSGSGSAMTRRSMPVRLAGRSSSEASRVPARPARASPIAVSILASGGVRLARGEVRPSNCSANVTAVQAAFLQKNRLTPSQSRTGCPPTGASASRRRYVLCTRSENWPHFRQAAPLVRARAQMRRRSCASSAVSTMTTARCGSSSSRLIPRWHDKYPLTCDNVTADSWEDGWTRQPSAYQGSLFPLAQHAVMHRNDPDRYGLPPMRPGRGSLPSRNTGQIQYWTVADTPGSVLTLTRTAAAIQDSHDTGRTRVWARDDPSPPSSDRRYTARCL